MARSRFEKCADVLTWVKWTTSAMLAATFEELQMMSKDHFVPTAVEVLPDYRLRLMPCQTARPFVVDLSERILTTAIWPLRDATLFEQAKVGLCRTVGGLTETSWTWD